MLSPSDFIQPRNSKMIVGEVYFWTNTVKDWKLLLRSDKYKELIIYTWRVLVLKELISVYGFVIMPNHLHVVWRMLAKNGKEMPYASFNKASGHLIVKDLKHNHPIMLNHFKVDEQEREYRIWQRDPLAILMDSKEKVEQKLEYTHNNPLQEHWQLADRPEDYFWSSAKFYQDGEDQFGFLTDYRERY